MVLLRHLMLLMMKKKAATLSIVIFIAVEAVHFAKIFVFSLFVISSLGLLGYSVMIVIVATLLVPNVIQVPRSNLCVV